MYKQSEEKMQITGSIEVHTYDDRKETTPFATTAQIAAVDCSLTTGLFE